MTSGSAQQGFTASGSLRARRGMSLRARLRSKDSYGIVLILIFASLLITATIGDSRWGRFLTLAVQGGTLLFAQWTSAVHKRFLNVTEAAIVLALLAGAVSLEPLGHDLAEVGAVVGALLAASTIVIIVRRLGFHPAITGSTVLGAVSVYLLLGLMFAYIYGALALFDPPFFLQTQQADTVDVLYYSLVTLTTVGYGDFTAASSLGRMLSVTEALMGQVYLVTVVALLVANLGRRRTMRSTGTSAPSSESFQGRAEEES